MGLVPESSCEKGLQGTKAAGREEEEGGKKGGEGADGEKGAVRGGEGRREPRPEGGVRKGWRRRTK